MSREKAAGLERKDKREAERMNVISLGAGVQSTTLLLMAVHGEITPKPEYAIFSDTGWEPTKVYKHLELLRMIAKKAGIKVITTI